jgi:hypothetical protein
MARYIKILKLRNNKIQKVKTKFGYFIFFWGRSQKVKKAALFLVLMISSFLFGHSVLFAQELDHSNFRDTEQCLTCHGKEDLVTEKNGKTISLYLDKEKYAKSRHGSMPCISCHDFTKDNQDGGNASEKISGKGIIESYYRIITSILFLFTNHLLGAIMSQSIPI